MGDFPVPAANMIVAVVDDDEGMRRSICAILEIAGFPTRSYGSAEAFLADGDVGGHVCALIVDQNLGRTTGLDLIRVVAARAEYPAILLISAELTPQLARAALTAGATEAKHKPVSPSEVINFCTKAKQRSNAVR